MQSKFTMPRFPEPYWKEEEIPSFEKLKSDTATDIAVVGGGITGITTAYLLAKEGFNVTLLESGDLINGTTGHTTAKVTAQHGLLYDDLINHLGEEKASLYYQSQAEALHFIRGITSQRKIECDFSNQDAFIYAESKKSAKKLEKEMEAYQKLGISGEISDSIPFNIDTKAVLSMKNQAQFHPLKYLKPLLQDFLAAGGKVYEHTTASDIEEGENPHVVTNEGFKVQCKHVVIASHFPFADFKGFYFAKMHPERSYSIGVKTKKDYPGGMYYSADKPSRSLRTTPFNGEELIIVGGESHKTGQGSNTVKHYEALEGFAEEVLGITEYPYRWSSQDLFTLDMVPFIGPITSKQKNIYVATGFRKWGMTLGTAAAFLIKDLILERENVYADLFNPARFEADPSIKKFIATNTNVAAHLVKGKLEPAEKKKEELKADEGAVVKINGKRTGAYKDGNNELHLVDRTCTHMGCECEWNQAERTWDCPCHGSRFSYKGDVVEGPAVKPLKKVELE